MVYPDTLIVLTPKHFNARALEKIVEGRMSWAEKRLAEKAAEYKRFGLPKTYLGGETFPYLGDTFPLVVVQSRAVKRSRCEFSGERFFVETPSHSEADIATAVRRALFKWYRTSAERDIVKRVAAWTPITGKAPAKVSIRSQKTRWGSCSVKGSVNFNWRLIMATPGIIDYVVVHELCHLVEHNHSAAYWALVERALPDYRARRKQLKDAGYLLEID